ncbi:MAG: exodeoxyribonuclease VII small subunit [Pirellulales bacterium]
MKDEPAEENVVEPLGFEQAMEKLEAIVRELEDGRIGLTEALARYEEGVKFLRQCFDFLQKAERRIEMLVGVDAEGNPRTEPFDDRDSLSLDEKSQSRGRRRSAKKSAAEVGGEVVMPQDPNMDESAGLF